MTDVHLLSAFNDFNVNSIDAISVDSVDISVMVQLQTEDPLEWEK